jgi:glycosyltransferase involved in cell wall biosynthesis
MRESICTLVPSTWAEPFGRTVLESLSVGTPVLVSDLGGLKELVGPGVTGVPAGDARAWGEAISGLLLEGADARVARANEARRRFDGEFGPERWWETTMKIFDQVSRARSEGFDEQMGADG